MDIDITRAIVHATLTGEIDKVEYEEDPLFHILAPRSCPHVPSEILNPRNTWDDKDAFDQLAQKLAQDFSAHFDRAYGDKGIDPAVARQCPGK